MRAALRGVPIFAAVLLASCGGGGGGGGGGSGGGGGPGFSEWTPPPPAGALQFSSEVRQWENFRQRAAEDIAFRELAAVPVLTMDSDRLVSNRDALHGTAVEQVLQLAAARGSIAGSRCESTTAAEFSGCLGSGRAARAKVINYSRVLLGENIGFSPPADAVFVIAAGNELRESNTDGVAATARASGRVLVVAGADLAGQELARGSSPCGAAADWCLLAPFQLTLGSIPSALRTDDYNWCGEPNIQGILCGTSFSAAFVSGVAASIRARWPVLSAEETVRLILDECVNAPPGATPAASAGRGVLSLECLFAGGTLRLPDGYGLVRGTLVGAGAFLLPPLPGYDDYGRDFLLPVAQRRAAGRRPLGHGLLDAATLIEAMTRPGERHGLRETPFSLLRPLDGDAGRLWWLRASDGSSLFGHLRSDAGSESAVLGILRPLGTGGDRGFGMPMQLILGAGLDRGALAGGEITGTGALRPGNGLSLFGGLQAPIPAGRWLLTPRLLASHSRQLQAARGSRLEAMQGSQWSLGLAVVSPWRGEGKTLSLAVDCHGGMRGSARIAGRRLSLLPQSSCGALLSLRLPLF